MFNPAPPMAATLCSETLSHSARRQGLTERATDFFWGRNFAGVVAITRGMLVHEEVTAPIIGAAIAVHRELGPGLLESVYQECLAMELASRGIPFVRELKLPIAYRGRALAASLRLDFLVDETVILELKSVDRLESIHRCQLLSYLRLANRPLGLLINFNVPALKHGIIRVIHELNQIRPPNFPWPSP